MNMSMDLDIEEEIKNVVLEKVKKSSLLLLLGCLMYCEGALMLFILYGFRKKNIKRMNKIFRIEMIGRIMPLIIGLACSIIVFIFQNFNIIIKSEMTIEIMKNNMLSSVLLSFAIVGIISIIVLPIQEIKRLRGGN